MYPYASIKMKLAIKFSSTKGNSSKYFINMCIFTRFYVCLLVGWKIRTVMLSRSILQGSQITYGFQKMEWPCRYKYCVIIFRYKLIDNCLVRYINVLVYIMQSFGSQEWDAGFAIQALLATNLIEEIGPTLAKGHDFIKKSQVCLIHMTNTR